MKSNQLTPILLAVLCTVAAAQLCPSQTLSAGIISDSLTFAPGSNTPLQNGVNLQCFNYTFQAAFSSTYQIAVATTGFEASPTADLVYYVRPNPSPVVLNSISFQVRTPWKLGQFSKLTVSFMAENRNDIELGSRVIDSAFVGGCGQKSQQFSFNFGRAQSITPTTVVRLFLNGISESTNGGSPFELRLTSLSPNSQGVTFTLTINGASNIDSIYLSYLVYDSSSFAIPSTDGTFERATVYNLITQQLANNRINNFNYALYGLSGFEFSSQYAPSFSAKIDNNLLLTVTGLKNVQSYLAVSYILIRGSCSSCSNYPYLSGTNCVQNCPQGFPQNGVCPTAVLPPVCPAFSTYNGSTCVCVQNYFNISGSCQQCPPGTNYNGYQCAQSGGFCPQNSFFNLSTNQCQCSTNFYNISGVCQQCPPGSQWNGYQCSQFGGQCPANANINPLTGRCECIPNYYIINGACQQCGPGTQWNGQYCAPFQPQVNCGANSFFNGSINQCQCNPNYYNISGSCQQCQPGSQWNGQMCAQVNPPNPSGPGISCPYGSNCVLFCSNYLNTVYNPSNNQCVCSSNTFFIQGTCQSCPNGWQFNGFTCIQQNQPICPPNSYRVGSNCVCNDGYIQTPSGCTPGGIVPPPPISCADSMYFDQRNGACVLCSNGCGSCTSSNSCNRCNPGYRLNNRKCSEICGDGIRFVLACDDGNTRNGDGCSRQCKIEPGFSCFGGSPTTPDSCTRERPTSIMIYPTGQTHMSGKVMSNVRVSWLPTQLSSSGCRDCLDVRMISGSNIPRISSQYIQGTSFSFSIQFDFVREPIQDFKYQVKLNQNLQPFFAGIDISYTAVVSVSPSVLALSDQATTLDLAGLEAVAYAADAAAPAGLLASAPALTTDTDTTNTDADTSNTDSSTTTTP